MVLGFPDRFARTARIRPLVNRSFQVYAVRRTTALAGADPVRVQERTLRRLLFQARNTRFGRDHGFEQMRTVEDFQKAVPLRAYESLWNAYLKAQYPVFENLTWPGRIPYLALTSGTTEGPTKYIPVSRAMLASNRKAARTLIAYHMTTYPESHLFNSRLLLLGGSTNLEQVAPGVRQGDLSGIMALDVPPLLRPYSFPPLELALETDWDVKLARMAELAVKERISLVSGVPSWLLALFNRVLEQSGKTTISEVWPDLEVVVHGGVKFDPYRTTMETIIGNPRVRYHETYACSEGFVGCGDPATELLRLLFDNGIFYEFVPLDELESAQPTRHWLGNIEPGVNYAVIVSTCAGLWGHILGDTIRFEQRDPPLFHFTGRTRYTLSAFGEHLINEEVEAAMAAASAATGAMIRDWHVGPVFEGQMGYHVYAIEFLRPPDDPVAFRAALDRDLSGRNADYQAHRAEGVGLPLPMLVAVSTGGFDAWLRARGKLGGQHKVPRMDGSGALTQHMADFLRTQNLIDWELPAG